MDEVATLLERIKANGHEVWISGNTSPDAILSLEKQMEITLPVSLKWFLENYGALGIYDSFISGIIDNEPLNESGGGIYSDTKFAREEFKDMPDGLWVISKHEDGAYCLDTNSPTKNGEFAIVNYEHSQKPVVVSNSFSEYLCKWFLVGWANETA